MVENLLMAMRNIFTVLIFSVLFINMYAQDVVEPDDRLYARYSNEQIEYLLLNSPQLIEFRNFELDNSWEILEVEKDKSENYPPLQYFNPKTGEKLNEVEDVVDSDFNLYQYYFQRKHSHRSFYKIGDTNKVLIIYSGKELINLFNKDVYEK